MMKKAYFLITILFLFVACSKKSGVQPQNSNSVTINGTSYPTVTIGNLVWTTVNCSGSGGYHSTDHAQYGDYYTQAQALAISLPSGWRVPSISDYNTLMSNYTSEKDNYGYFRLSAAELSPLISTSGWSDPLEGTNTSGFNAQPAGYFSISGQTPVYESFNNAYFMTSDVSNQNGMFGFSIENPGAYIEGASDVALGTTYASLRFVKNK